jgi:Fe2+ transport system protein FeoA
LTQFKAGEFVVIRRIHETAEDNADLMKFLENNAVIPGTEAEIYEILPFNQTITLGLGDRKVVLGFPTAHYIYVEKV